jgi:hypothetical protein
VITETTTLDRGERASAKRTRRRTFALAGLAVGAALVVGVVVGSSWPEAPAATSSESLAAPMETGAIAHADDYLVRYLARVHDVPTTGSVAAPADEFLIRYLARVHNAPTPASGAAPADDYLARYLARHNVDTDS